jgi:hypothetical protein
MTPPKFEKEQHHIVPAGWQRRFFPRSPLGALGRTGFYKDVRSGRLIGPEGPGQKMSEEWANTVFDRHFRPSDAVEDWCSTIETPCLRTIDEIAATRLLRFAQREDIATWMALQSCRYPHLYQPRLNLGRYYAIAIAEAHRFEDLNAFKTYLAKNGVPSNCYPDDAEFKHLRSLAPDIRERTINPVLTGHGYEWFLNKGEVVAGAFPTGLLLTQVGWELLEATDPWFILSDRPVPEKFDHTFAVALTYDLALRITPSVTAIPADLHGRRATLDEVHQVNAEIRERADRWICGPDAASIQSL